MSHLLLCDPWIKALAKKNHIDINPVALRNIQAAPRLFHLIGKKHDEPDTKGQQKCPNEEVTKNSRIAPP